VGFVLSGLGATPNPTRSVCHCGSEVILVRALCVVCLQKDWESIFTAKVNIEPFSGESSFPSLEAGRSALRRPGRRSVKIGG
jgi:hypothetical protein